MFILLLIFIFLKKINKKSFNIYDVFVLLVLVIICGFRRFVGTDYQLYINMYNKLDWFPHLEFLIKQLIVLLNYLKLDYTSFFFLMAFLTFSIMYKAVKEQSVAPAESILYYVCFGYYAMAFNGIRQMLAISICLYSLKYIKDKQFIKYLLLIVIATMCHTTSIIMLPMYYFGNKDLKKSTLQIITIISLFGFVFYNPIYRFVVSNFDRFSDYAVINGMTYSEAGLGTYVIGFIHFALIFIALKYYDKIINVDEKNKIYINLLIFSTIFFSLSFVNTVVVRMAYFFTD